MRVHFVFILPVLLLQFAANPDEKSNLELVVDELSILTRVTSAIAIQSSMIRKTLSIETTIADFLNADESVLASLANSNTSLLIREFPKFFETAKTLTTPILNSETLKNIKKFGYLFYYSPVQFSNEYQHVYASDLINLLKQGKGINLPCPDEVLDVVSKFYDVITDTDNSSQISKADRQDNMVKMKAKVVECFKACGSYRNSSIGGLYEELKHLKNANILADILINANSMYDTLKNIPNLLRNATDDYKKAAPLGLFKQKIGSMVRAAADDTKKLRDHIESASSVFTGFPEGSNDVQKVREDIESDWFQKKVSRGKSTGALETALEQFHELVAELVKLEHPWEQLVSEKSLEDVKKVAETAKQLNMLQNFDANVTMLKLMNESQTIMDECWGLSPIKTAEPLSLEKFKKKYELPRQVTEKIDRIINKASGVTKRMNVDTFKDLIDKLESVTSPSTTENDENNQKTNIQEMENIKRLMSVFEQMKQLHYAQMSYEKSFAKLMAGNDYERFTFYLGGIVSDTNLHRVMLCLNDSSFHAYPFMDIFDFLDSVPTLGTQTNFDLTMGFLKRLDAVQKVIGDIKNTAGNRRKRDVEEPAYNSILMLQEPQDLALNLGGGMHVLREMVKALRGRLTLRGPTEYPAPVLKKIRETTKVDTGGLFWRDPARAIDALLKGLDTFDQAAGELRDGELNELSEVFRKADKVPGIDQYQEIFEEIVYKLPDSNPDIKAAIENSKLLKKWDLDFAMHKKTLSAASLSVESVSDYFDEVFGFKSTAILAQFSNYAVAGICFGIVFLIIFAGFVGYGFTKNGKSKYKNWFLYYFPNEKEFARRRRYSLFMDRENFVNSLVDSSREINLTRIKNALKKGCYVNVYSIHGNTPLHWATKSGYSDFVDLLIKNGADRSLLNYQNRTAESCCMADCELPPEEAEMHGKVAKVYEKHRNKTYRQQVPREFPTYLYHIYLERRTDDHLTDTFRAKYPGITSEEPLATTTHCICKTDKHGVLETDNVWLLAMIFRGVIMVKESWMTECLNDDKAIERDYEHLVTDVRFNGVLYKDCILPWSKAMALGEMPYLSGAYVVFFMTEPTPNMEIWITVLGVLGGTNWNEYPQKELFIATSHPYLHANLGPVFVIHNNNEADIAVFRNDKDHLYALFTEEEFVAFLLKREIHRDTLVDPPLQLLAEEIATTTATNAESTATSNESTATSNESAATNKESAATNKESTDTKTNVSAKTNKKAKVSFKKSTKK